MSEEAGRTEAAVSFDQSLARVLSELFRRRRLVFFVDCVREKGRVEEKRVLDWDVRMVFVNLEVISAAFCSSLDDYIGVLSVLRACKTEGRVLREQRIYASQKSGAQKKLLHGFVPTRREREGKEDMWVGKKLLLCRCMMKKEREGA